MKKLITSLFFISFVVFAFGQYVNQHNMRYETSKRTSKSVVKYQGQQVDYKAFGDIIYEEHFSGAMPAGWGTSNTIAWNWVWTDTGPAGVTAGADEDLISTTAADGWMMYDSDAGPNGAYEADLISASYDFSAYSSVMMSIEEFFRKWNDPGPNQIFVMVSNDSTNWTSFELHDEFFSKDQSPNPAVPIFINISSVAGNQPKVWVKFRMIGDWDYNWQIDDLIFYEASENDLRIHDIWPGFMYTNGGFMYMNPYNQPYRVFFGAEVLNFGNNDAVNVTLDVDVSGANSGSVYTESYDTVIISAATDNMPDSIGTDNANPWIYDSIAIDTYTITYTVSSDSLDEDPASTVATYEYIATDSVYARDHGDPNTRWHISPQRWSSGGTDGDIFGVKYYMNHADYREMSSISFYVHADSDTGSTVRGQLYYNDGQSTDWTLLLETDFYTINDADTWVTLPFLTDGFSEFIPAGDVIVALEFVEYDGADVAIAEDRSIYRDVFETLWKFTGDDWTGITNYCKVPYIRLNEKGTCNVASSAVVTNETSAGANDGAIDLTVSGGTAPYIFSWTGPNGYTATTEDITGLETGDYTVEITDDTGCNITETYSVYIVGIKDISLVDVKFYPNPTNGIVRVKGVTKGTAYVYDILGEVVSTQNVSNQIDLSSLQSGNYYIKVVTEEGAASERISLVK